MKKKIDIWWVIIMVIVLFTLLKECTKTDPEIVEKEVIKIMLSNLKESSFKRWRKRVNSGVSSKHLKKRSAEITRFKCSRQNAISGNKISKR